MKSGHWAIPHIGQRLVSARVIGSTEGGATVDVDGASPPSEQGSALGEFMCACGYPPLHDPRMCRACIVAFAYRGDLDDEEDDDGSR